MPRLFLLLACLATTCLAADPTTVGAGGEYETTVTGRRPITAASSLTVRDRDLKLRLPGIHRPADVLEVTPGLYTVQHAGGGKANQYFLRGFDADHGTDVAISVDGVPVNQVSHGHGQGYADLHWLIPELVERVEVYKGTYFPWLGDFATAGGINLVTRRGVDMSQASLTAGSFGTVRAMAMASADTVGKPLVAAEVYRSDGPFQVPELTRRFNVFLKGSHDFSAATKLAVAATAYGGDWRASGQIPLREVAAGRLDRFGTIDPSDGGDSNRYGLYGALTHDLSPDSQLKVAAYTTYQRLSLFSNFTFFSRDPVNGDQINQRDNRVYYGGDASFRTATRWEGKTFETTVGLQGRSDGVTNGLFNTRQRVTLGTVTSHDIRETSLALHAGEDVTWTPWLRSVVGARLDTYRFAVTDRTTGLDRGAKSASLVTPKASVILSPVERTDVYLNYGMGFHSNDARGVLATGNPATPLTRAAGYELGSRTRLLDDKLDVAASVFLIYLDDELVYSGDSGTTESVGPTRRDGLELEARYKITSWLAADVDLTFSKAEIRAVPGNANSVSNAPTRLVGAGLTAQHPEGWFGRLSAFHIGPRALTEDRFLMAEGFTRFDLSAGYRQKRYEIAVAVQNLFNTSWREAQFATTSRLPGETGPASCPAGTRPQNDDKGAFAGCQDVHFTPGAPWNVQATGTVFF